MSSLDSFGLSAAGLAIPRQEDFTSSLQASWAQSFGAQVNLDPRSNNGQLINIMAERFAYLAELLEAIYNASYPSGAEGVAVDNLLALQGLKRLGASATATARSPITQSNGITLYGLVCYGDPGTVIPAGSLVADSASPAHQFATEAAITIGAAQNATQAVTLNPAPTSGSFALKLKTAAGQEFTTPSFNYDVNASELAATLIEISAPDGSRPFSDIYVSRAGNVITFVFGGGAQSAGQASNAAKPVALIKVASSSLQPSVSVNVAGVVAGQPAQGVGLATAIQTGPSSVPSGTLTVIATPVSGWNAVINQLDCVSGQDAETDAEALARRASLVASQAQGPLAAVLQRVQQIPGVTAAKAFTNTSMASQQTVTVRAATSGTFALAVGGQTTATLPYSCTAAQLQAVLRALSSGGGATVTGSATSGLVVDWGQSFGGQAVPLMAVTLNTTGTPIDVRFSRYPKSLELVVEGGSDADVAQAIFAATPAGLATFGQPVSSTTLTVQAGSSTATVADSTGLVVGLGVVAFGVQPGVQVQSINGNQLTLSAAALSSYSNTPVSFGYFVPLKDSSGNLQIVNFSRPQRVRFYCAVTLTTDQYVVPGDSTSGTNPSSLFSSGSIPSIQTAIKAVFDGYGIGATLVATGSGGIANAFRNVPGIDDVQVAFDVTSPPQNTGRFTLQAQQVAELDLADITVNYV